MQNVLTSAIHGATEMLKDNQCRFYGSQNTTTLLVLRSLLSLLVNTTPTATKLDELFSIISATDSSNTLVCTKNDQPFMQGVIKDTQDRTIYFHNIAAFHEWIVNPAKPSSINEVAFHDKLAEFESNFRHNDSLKNGSAIRK
uniref:Uncharacterized protein n=1 Tax=Romanomermis culicivorax TaxID=13658 RepID=A0A915HZ41_ROMCU